MINEYVPKVLVVGDAERFRARTYAAGRPAKVVGVASFHGIFDEKSFDLINTQQFLLDGKLVDTEFLKVLSDRHTFDYLVFMTIFDALTFTAAVTKQYKLVPDEQVITIGTFMHFVRDNFFTFTNITVLYRILANQKIHSLLDADACFAHNTVYIKPIPDGSLAVEGIFDKPVLPIFTNVYSRHYNTVADCALRHYDAILLTAERDWEALMTKFYELSNMTEMFIVFVRDNCPITRFADEDRWPREFLNVNYNKVVNGRWFLVQKAPPKDAGLYVVSHKKYSVELPEGYTTIHAGRELGSDLGYVGDDSGRNISALNPYLNEMTAAYWIWKNTSHDIVGISHYRRFFSSKRSRDFEPKNILTRDQAVRALRSCDMIVALEDNYAYNQFAFLVNDVGQNIASTAITLTKTMMTLHQPEYVDVFDHVMHTNSIYRCNMMVTRKHVFDAYCEWLFSFLLPAHAEFMKLVSLDRLTTNQKRIFGYLAERMMNIWLLKNNLRLKELPIMENIDQPKQLERPEDEVTLNTDGDTVVEADFTKK